MTMVERLKALLGWSDRENPVDFGALDGETQIIIATEAALAAAVDWIVFQKNAWVELCDGLEAMGLVVGLSPEATDYLNATMKRLRAAMAVVGDNIGVDPESLRNLNDD